MTVPSSSTASKRNIRPKGGYLLFEDGTRFDGEFFFGLNPGLGEAVFNTSSSGYQEILSDPSYHKQIMTFTTPHIGNVGVNDQDSESTKIHCAGMVVRSLTRTPSNYRSEGDLAEWMMNAGVPVLVGSDTRSITLHIRSHGAQRAGIFSDEISNENAIEMVKSSPEMEGANLAEEISCEKEYLYARKPSENDNLRS